jgi:transcriptional antiterminator RfaH
MLSDLSNPARVWSVFLTKPRKESVSVQYLTREGFETYCPKVMTQKKGRAGQPLFPGYLFIRLSPKLELTVAARCPGILRPLIFGNQVAIIEETIISGWKERENGTGYIRPEPRPAFEQGQKVRFSEGPFAGLDGEVLEDLPAKERVRVLLEHLGMSVAVEAGRSTVRTK